MAYKAKLCLLLSKSLMNISLENKKIAIIGLGYIGLPLSIAFSSKYFTVGFDISANRVKELGDGFDSTLEVDTEKLKNSLQNGNFTVSRNAADIASCNIYIITVPTPIDKNNRPLLNHLYAASKTVGEVLKKGDVVIYESTVYPGVTEDICVPILAENSKLVFNKDFFVGYSPERMNPGDKQHTVTNILKITSGSTNEVAILVDNLYNSIITAGTFKAASIKVAEAAKAIENCQRDINIAFVNELSKIFNLIGIDTNDVLDAAGTKWNFLKFKPGLVGGHCIGVDPYYLAQKAQEIGYHPEIILSGRRLNDGMSRYVATEAIKLMIKKDIKIKGAQILILGFTFKENCPDVRNTKVFDIVNELKTYEADITIVDPWANSHEVEAEYGIHTLTKLPECKYDAVIMAVAHSKFIELDYKQFLKPNSVVYDVKGIVPRHLVDGRL